MQFLNFEKIGSKFCKIMDTGKKDKDREFVYLDKTGKKEDSKFFSRFQTEHKLQLYPNDLIRCIYIFGPSGSGKSTYIRNYWLEYCKLYSKLDPQPNLYLFSAKVEDSALDGVAKRINIMDMLQNPIEYTDFAPHDLVVFDDCETLEKGPIYDIVFSLMYQILELARSHGVNCIVTNHESHGKHVKKCINESHVIVFFPNAGNINYFLKQYLGFSAHQIRYLEKSGSRTCSFYRNYPKTVLLEKEIFNMCDTFIEDKITEEKENRKLKGKNIKDKEKVILTPSSSEQAKIIEEYNNKSTKMIKEYGDFPITSIDIRRWPIKNALKELEKVENDKLFHFDLVLTIKDKKYEKKIIVGKHEAINISTNYSQPEDTENYNVKIPRDMTGLTLSKILGVTLENIGPKNFFMYDQYHNSQRFIRDILESIGLYDEDIKKFLIQDVKKIMDNCIGGNATNQLIDKWSGRIVVKVKRPVGRPKKVKN